MRGSCGWVGVLEVPPGDVRAVGDWERMRATARPKQRAGRVSSEVVRHASEVVRGWHARGVAHVSGVVEQDRVACLVLLGRAEGERSRNVHCWVGWLFGAEARVLPDLGCRVVQR